MVEKMKADVDKLHFISKIKNSLISQNIFEFFGHYRHKLEETGPNFSHELATFFKYHMPEFK